MLYRPSDLPPAERDRFEEHAVTLRGRLLDHVEGLLADLESDAAAQHVYDLAFSTSDVLPKRQFRPKLDSALLAEQVYREHDPDDGLLASVLEFTVADQEYFDMLDDLVDGDVAADRRDDVILATQLLLPLMLRRLERFGAVEYWADETNRLLEAPLEEGRASPSAEAYRTLLDRQAGLYGSTAAIAAMAAGADDAATTRAASIGETLYRHRQLVLDYEQYRTGETEGWNAGVVFDRETIVETLAAERDRIEDLTAAYDAENAARLRGLVALDVDTWLSLLEETQGADRLPGAESER